MSIAVLLLMSSLAHARDVTAEPSRFGTFTLVASKGGDPSGGCHVALRTADHGDTPLLDLDYCGTGFAALAAPERIGTLMMPASSVDGVEFHVFTAPAEGSHCRMGGDYDEVYVVVLSAGHAWVSGNLGGCSNLDFADVSSAAHGPTITLGQNPSTTLPGTSSDVWMGGSTTKELPKVASKLVASSSKVVVGKLDAQGGGWTSLRPYVEDANGDQTIFGAGACKLDALDGRNVTLSYAANKYDDGREEDVCVSVVAK